MKKFSLLIFLVPLLALSQNAPQPVIITIPATGTTYVGTDYDDQDAVNGNYSFTPLISYSTSNDPGIFHCAGGTWNDVPGQAHTISGSNGHYHIECYNDPTKICFSWFKPDDEGVCLSHLGVLFDADQNPQPFTYYSGAILPAENGGVTARFEGITDIDASASNFRIMSGGPKIWATYPGKATIVSTGNGGYSMTCDSNPNMTCFVVWVY